MFGSTAAAGIGFVVDGVLAVGGLLAPAKYHLHSLLIFSPTNFPIFPKNNKNNPSSLSYPMAAIKNVAIVGVRKPRRARTPPLYLDPIERR